MVSDIGELVPAWLGSRILVRSSGDAVTVIAQLPQFKALLYFPSREAALDSAARFVEGDNGAFPEWREGRLRRRQFLAIHPIDLALH